MNAITDSLPSADTSHTVSLSISVGIFILVSSLSINSILVMLDLTDAILVWKFAPVIIIGSTFAFALTDAEFVKLYDPPEPPINMSSI